MILTAFSVLLSVNYLSGWAYDGSPDSRTIKNDSVTVMASHQYAYLNPLKYIFLGKNYRREWSTPVKMQVFHISENRGGFRIEKLGGGEQTKSLHLEDSKGRKWVLRTVDKDVSEAMPPALKNTFIQNIVQDQISAAYPYAPLTIYDLSAATGVVATGTELYFVPDDTALGQYRPYFANSICFLKEKESSAHKTETEDTEEVRTKLLSGTGYRMKQEMVLKARLLDMLIADWDRHDKQWEWAVTDSAGAKYYYPIPEDRDQAFFYTGGLIAHLVKIVGMPHLVGFNDESKSLKRLNYKAHDFDRFFMNSLDRKTWEHTIIEFQKNLSDEVLYTAVKKLPPEIYDISGPFIKEKLKGRRDGLLQHGLEYYDFIAQSVIVHTTASKEYISIKGGTDSLNLTITDASRQVVYKRTFFPAETGELTIENTGNEDTIEMPQIVPSGIKLTINKRQS